MRKTTSLELPRAGGSLGGAPTRQHMPSVCQRMPSTRQRTLATRAGPEPIQAGPEPPAKKKNSMKGLKNSKKMHTFLHYSKDSGKPLFTLKLLF
jgi:hypothetical protein